MTDLVCLLADKSIEAAVTGLLARRASLRVRSIHAETVVHPRNDSGCFHEAAELLRGYVGKAEHALVVLDRAWDGAPATTGEELERALEVSLRGVGANGWARAIVIDPELEAWVFSDSPHVATALGWEGSVEEMRAAMAANGLWADGLRKPADPKAAVDWALRRAKRPRSSSMYRRLASSVGLSRCQDRSFLRLLELLRAWYGTDGGRS